MNSSITFLTDTPPLKSKGSGISVLLYHFLEALKGRYQLNVITFCQETNVSCTNIAKDNVGKKIFICDRKIEKAYQLLRFGTVKKMFQFCSYVISIPHILKKYNTKDNTIITIVGASVKPVIKAWILMLLAKKSKHCLYIVDDLELINKKLGNKIEILLISIFLRRAIQKTNLLICISRGLSMLYLNKYDKKSILLLPHFKKTPPILSRKSSEKEFIFLFTGGLNLLYNESLKYFASVIETINNECGVTKYRLVIQSYSSRNDFDALNFNPQFVSYSTTESRDDLIGVYKNCDFFLVPYSFANEDRGVVVTSFPQKIAEIIQYQKKILIFAPAYSSVSQMFISENLNYVCSEKSVEQLKFIIQKMCFDTPEEDLYFGVYQKYFSSEATVKIFEAVSKKLNS